MTPYLRAAVALLLVGTSAPAAEAQQPLSADRIDELAERGADNAFRLYRELLTFPNDANHPDDILRLTEWLERQFRDRRFDVRRLEMPGSDALLATRDVPGADRTVLIYLQADGQPVDPARWHQQSPWNPVVKARRPGATIPGPVKCATPSRSAPKSPSSTAMRG